MNKAFTKETDDDDDDQPEIPLVVDKNYVTPFGDAQLKNEFNALLKERLKVVEIVRWAAGNGDRSENGDYIYNKKRLREIDRRTRYLKKRIESAKIVDPALQKNLSKVFFGATVTYKENNVQSKVKIVGIDEADLQEGKISYISPVARALLKAEIGDVVKLKTPEGVKKLEIIGIEYI
jgi:transcription elongation factor GreB